MHFLPDVYVSATCARGKRYNRETLEIRFKGKSIADVLDMTVEEALEFFDAMPAMRNKLARPCSDVGLGYIHLGQSATTLSGGRGAAGQAGQGAVEAAATGKTLYILDEPTTGLHFDDVRKLLDVLHALVDQATPWW